MEDQDLYIDAHAFKHGIKQEDIEHAWEHFTAMQHRGAPHEGQIVLVGPDRRGRAIQVVAATKPYGTLIYHAMRPPQVSTLIELGLARR